MGKALFYISMIFSLAVVCFVFSIVIGRLSGTFFEIENEVCNGDVYDNGVHCKYLEGGKCTEEHLQELYQIYNDIHATEDCKILQFTCGVFTGCKDKLNQRLSN